MNSILKSIVDSTETTSMDKSMISLYISYKQMRQMFSLNFSHCYTWRTSPESLQQLQAMVVERESFLTVDRCLLSTLDRLERLEVRGQLSDLESESLTIILSILFEGEYDLYPDKRDDLYNLQRELDLLSSKLAVARMTNALHTRHELRKEMSLNIMRTTSLLKIYSLIHLRPFKREEVDTALSIARLLLDELEDGLTAASSSPFFSSRSVKRYIEKPLEAVGRHRLCSFVVGMR